MTTGAGWGDDVLAICELKYAYVRLLDTKQFDELGALLTEGATSAYDGGAMSQQGRAAIVSFLRGAVGSPDIVTMHTVHHPEIRRTGPDTATGTWYLEDRVVVRPADLVIAGTALYQDDYVRTADGWRFAHTGYQRIFEEHRVWSTGAATRFTSRFDPPAG